MLTGFTVYHYDNTSTDLTVTVQSAAMNASSATSNAIHGGLVVDGPAGGGVVAGQHLGSFTSSGTPGYSAAAVSASGTIDNTTRAYSLRAVLPSYQYHAISGVRVSYTVSQAE